MDSLSVLMVSAPVFLPLATYLGFDLLWLGVLFSINSEMDYIPPPFGVNLVVMKGIVPKGITMGDIYKCVWPFVIIQAITLFLIILVPGLATWLPNLVFKQ